MISPRNSKPARRGADSDLAPATIPSPEKVRAAAAAIRRTWTPRERQRRAELGRHLLYKRLLWEFYATAETTRQARPNNPSSRS
jgi:hypothetical protein